MKKLLLGIFLFGLVFIGMYLLFPALSIPIVSKEFPEKGVLAVFWPEIIVICFGFLVFLLMHHMRTLVLIILIFGQMSLLFLEQDAWIFGREFPLYGLIAVNGVIFLCLYFLFAAHLWAPDELDVEDFD